jgi:diguanylate cyclase (GGDEF)-like protein/PAS domain S-box-containing protein
MSRANAAQPKPRDSLEPALGDAEDHEREPRGAESADAAPGLLGAGGAFAQFPGGGVLAGRGGRILGANQEGAALADLVARGAPPELTQALDAAFDGKTAQINPFLMEAAPSGGDKPPRNGQAWDLVALPWNGGAGALLLARDITLERSLRAALIESRERYKDLVEASSDFAWETDAAGRFTFVSPRGALGYAAAQLVGQRAEDFVVALEDVETTPFTTRSPAEGAEFWFRAADGEAACLSAVALPLLTPEGDWLGARGVCREITLERAREAELARARHREALLGYILRIVRDELEPASMLKAAAGALVPVLSARGVAIFQRDPNARLSRVAQAGRMPPAEAVKPLLEQLASGDDEAAAPCGEGHLFVKATRYHLDWNGALCLWRDGAGGREDEENRFLLGEIAAQVGVANEQLARERELEARSSTDSLTGLLNRRGFLERMERRFARAAGRDRPGVLLYIDLDNFKPVNDSHGHDAGDRVLAELAGLLKLQTRKADLAARLGGDEFAVFLDDLPAEAAARKAGGLAAEAAEMLGARAGAPGKPLGLSIGVAAYDPALPESLAELMARADRAMYAAKRGGKSRIALADPAPGDAPAADDPAGKEPK